MKFHSGIKSDQVSLFLLVLFLTIRLLLNCYRNFEFWKTSPSPTVFIRECSNFIQESIYHPAGWCFFNDLIIFEFLANIVSLKYIYTFYRTVFKFCTGIKYSIIHLHVCVFFCDNRTIFELLEFLKFWNNLMIYSNRKMHLLQEF